MAYLHNRMLPVTKIANTATLNGQFKVCLMINWKQLEYSLSVSKVFDIVDHYISWVNSIFMVL